MTSRAPRSRPEVRILVTGGTGFVGGHLVDALVARGATVTVLARSTAKARGLPAGVRVVPGDLADRAALERAVAGQHVVFHLAAVVAAPDEARYMRVNRDGTHDLVRAVEASGSTAGDPPRFVHVSSLAAAGPNARGARRDPSAADRPITAYGRSKLAGEATVRASGLRWTILRPPLVYGPGDPEVLRVFRMARRGIAPLCGDGGQELSAVYAPDLAEATMAAAANEATVGRTYYPCHPEPFTTADLARAVGTAVGRDVRLLRLSPRLTRLVLTTAGAFAALAGRASVLNRDKAAEFLAPAWTADPAPLYRDAGWIAATDLRTGLTATAHAYRESGWLR